MISVGFNAAARFDTPFYGTEVLKFFLSFCFHFNAVFLYFKLHKHLLKNTHVYSPVCHAGCHCCVDDEKYSFLCLVESNARFDY